MEDKDVLLAIVTDVIGSSPLLVSLDVYSRILNYNLNGTRQGIFPPSGISAKAKADGIIAAVANGEDVLATDAAWVLSQFYAGAVSLTNDIINKLKRLLP